MTKEQAIDALVNRFLGWKLPANFNPDGGITFKAEYNEHTDHPMRHEPVGTNLFDYSQAKQMIEHLLADEAPLVALLTPEMDDVPLSADDQARIDAAWEKRKAAKPLPTDGEQA